MAIDQEVMNVKNHITTVLKPLVHEQSSTNSFESVKLFYKTVFTQYIHYVYQKM